MSGTLIEISVYGYLGASGGIGRELRDSVRIWWIGSGRIWLV